MKSRSVWGETGPVALTEGAGASSVNSVTPALRGCGGRVGAPVPRPPGERLLTSRSLLEAPARGGQGLSAEAQGVGVLVAVHSAFAG